MTDHMTFVLDDDIPMVPLVEALNSAGLTISNIGGFRFRVHRLPGKVVSLLARRDRVTDRQIRAGMRSVFHLPPGTELEHGPVGLPPDGPGAA